MAMRPILLVLLGSAMAAAGAQPLERDRVESRVDQALENRLAESEEQVLRQRSRAIEAEGGPRLFGAVGANQVRDVVNRDLVRSYPALSAQVGVRWPLLGARDAEARQQASARAAVEQGGWRRAAVRAEALRTLRIAYVEALHRGEQAALAGAFLAHEPEATRILSRRWRQRLLLEADYREFLSTFAQARRDAALFGEERDRARRRLAAMTAEPADGDIAPPAFRTGCLTAERLLAGSGNHAALGLARARRDEQQRLLAEAGAAVPEAGLVVSQGLIQEIGGHTGGTTYLGVDFRLPLGWREAADARRAEALAQLQRSELAMEESSRRFEEAARQAVAGLAVRQAGLAFAAERTEVARLQLRTARLRLRLAEGDVIERYYQALQALYRTASDQVEAVLAFERAQVDVLALAPECGAEEGGPLPPGLSPTALTELAQPLAAAGLAPAPAPAGKFGWYAWAGSRWLERVDDLDAKGVFVHAGRIMLSFKADEIAALARQEPLAERLRRFLAEARARGTAVDLLLGDPDWLRPAGRGALLEYVRSLSGFAFDGLHLDLERSQLPARDQPAYPRWLVATIREVAAASPWPVALSVHYREVAAPALVEALRAAGLKELCLMVYSGNPGRVREIVAPILARHPGLAIAVAQSLEPQLPPGESLAGEGAASALTALDRVDRELRRFPNFAGVRVQSLEDFSRMRP